MKKRNDCDVLYHVFHAHATRIFIPLILYRTGQTINPHTCFIIAEFYQSDKGHQVADQYDVDCALPTTSIQPAVEREHVHFIMSRVFT